MQVGGLRMDVGSGQLWKAGEEIRLSPTEFEFLLFLMETSGRSPITLRRFCAPFGVGNTAAIMSTFAFTCEGFGRRSKTIPPRPKYIQTEKPVGYWLRNPSAADQPSRLWRRQGGIRNPLLDTLWLTSVFLRFVKKLLTFRAGVSRRGQTPFMPFLWTLLHDRTVGNRDRAHLRARD